ncbi:MAG: hypothetical protein WCS52_08340 [bacterium]
MNLTLGNSLQVDADVPAALVSMRFTPGADTAGTSSPTCATLSTLTRSQY